MQHRPRVYFGWYVVAVSFLTMSLSVGLVFAYSVYFVALIAEFGQSRGVTAGAGALNAVVAALVLPFIGKLFDRFGSRRLLPAGAVLTAVSLLLSAMAQSMWHFYLAYGVLGGIGFISLGFVPHTALISNWFRRRVGLALGLAFSGVGIGTAVFTPLSQYLIDTWGWRFAMVFFGLVILLILVPLTALVQVTRPEDKGLLPDDGPLNEPPSAPHEAAMAPPRTGDAAHHPRISAGSTQQAPRADQWSLRTALIDARFWWLFIVLFGGGYALQAVQTHHVALLVDVGIPTLTAAFFFSVLSVSRMGGQLFWGTLSDRLSRRVTFTLSSACFILGILILLFVRPPASVVRVYAYAIFFGFGSGALSSVPSALSTDIFRGGHFGVIFGVLDMGFQLGTAAGSWVSGVLFDLYGSYQIALLIASFAVVVSCACSWWAATSRRG